MTERLPIELYNNIQEHLPIPSVNLVVHKDGKVLLIKRTNQPELGKFWIPGGRILKNESMELAARRLTGKLGITIKRIKQSRTHEYISTQPTENIQSGIHHISTAFVIEAESVNIPEHIEYQWISDIDKLHEYPANVIKDSNIFQTYP